MESISSGNNRLFDAFEYNIKNRSNRSISLPKLNSEISENNNDNAINTINAVNTVQSMNIMNTVNSKNIKKEKDSSSGSENKISLLKKKIKEKKAIDAKSDDFAGLFNNFKQLKIKKKNNSKDNKADTHDSEK